MYADPRHIRDHVVKVRLNEDEMHLVQALSEYNRAQVATFAREMLLDAMRRQRKDENAKQLRLA